MSLTPVEPTRFLPDFARIVSERRSVKFDLVERVVAGYNSQLRHMEDEDAVDAYLLGEIATVARDYGARDAVPPPIMQECIRLVKGRFIHLGKGEIREAYRAYTVGELQVKGAEMYEGKFNASQLGKILGAYAKQRREVLGGYLNLVHDANLKEQKAAQAAHRAERFEREFPRLVSEARAAGLNWEAIPVFWFKAALNRDMFLISKAEADQILALAERVMRMRRRAELKTSPASALMERLNGKQVNPEEQAKNIARKITVYRKLIKS